MGEKTAKKEAIGLSDQEFEALPSSVEEFHAQTQEAQAKAPPTPSQIIPGVTWKETGNSALYDLMHHGDNAIEPTTAIQKAAPFVIPIGATVSKLGRWALGAGEAAPEAVEVAGVAKSTVDPFVKKALLSGDEAAAGTSEAAAKGATSPKDAEAAKELLKTPIGRKMLSTIGKLGGPAYLGYHGLKDVYEAIKKLIE